MMAVPYLSFSSHLPLSPGDLHLLQHLNLSTIYFILFCLAFPIQTFSLYFPYISLYFPISSHLVSSYLPPFTPGNPSVPSDPVPMGSSKNPLASVFDPWKGFDPKTPGSWTRDTLHMCVPGMETKPSRKVRKFNQFVSFFIWASSLTVVHFCFIIM